MTAPKSHRPSTEPTTYGDVTAEYLALHRGAGIVTGRRARLEVRGPDAVRFLDGLVSGTVAGLADGAMTRSLLLTPQGKLRAALWLQRRGDEIVIHTDRNRGELVRDDLTRFKIRVDAVIVGPEDDVIEVWGPDAERAIDAAGLEAAPLPFAHVALPRLAVRGGPEVIAALETAGAERVGSLAADAVRIEAGEPVVGRDVDESTIPQEAALVEGAVDWNKGCYLGQELVARIDSRGHVNRHLRVLTVRETVIPPAPAAIVTADEGREVGTITSVAESLEARAPIALGLVRREVEPGDTVLIRWDGGEANAMVNAVPLAVFS